MAGTWPQLAFTGRVTLAMLLALVLLKPAASLLCLGSGAPGGLFTPSLAIGALLGGLLGVPWSSVVARRSAGVIRSVWAPAPFLAATTQGPISAVVLMMELTGHARAFHRANVAGDCHRNARCTYDRASLDLRRTAQRRGGAETSRPAQSHKLNDLSVRELRVQVTALS